MVYLQSQRVSPLFRELRGIVAAPPERNQRSSMPLAGAAGRVLTAQTSSIRYKMLARRNRPNIREETKAMPTYIMLSTLTPEGVQTVKNNPQRIREVNKEVEQLGASVKAQWATLGHVDFISVIEAPDEGTMARVSLELGSRGTGRYETLAAIPIDDFIASL
jgi:uncharacterized protein with GYD domain